MAGADRNRGRAGRPFEHRRFNHNTGRVNLNINNAMVRNWGTAGFANANVGSAGYQNPSTSHRLVVDYTNNHAMMRNNEQAAYQNSHRMGPHSMHHSYAFPPNTNQQHQQPQYLNNFPAVRSRNRRRHQHNRNSHSESSTRNDTTTTDMDISEPPSTVSSAASANDVSSSTTSAGPNNSTSLEIPGFYWDPIRKKYFRRAVDQVCTPAAECFGDEQQRQKQLVAASHAQVHNEQQVLSDKLVQHPPIGRMLVDRQMGGRPGIGRSRTDLSTRISDLRLRSCATKPSSVHEALPNHPDEPLHGCQFLECAADGKTVIGSWKLNTPWAREACARIMCLNAEQEVDKKRDVEQCTNSDLKFAPTEHYIYAFDPAVVDFCQAPVDKSVTCVLYVTNPPLPECGSRVFLQPVPDLSCEEHTDNYYSPIYNIHWTLGQGVTACAWNSAQMRVALGLDTASLIVDVQSEKDFKLSTRHKRVLTEKFSKDGNLLFVGLRGSDTLCCDLRLPAHHIVRSMPQCSTEWIHLMPDADYMIGSDLYGNMYQWDLRMNRILHQFHGHKNSAWKLPHAVDPDQNYLFAASDDGTVRGWSLRTSELLCSIAPCNTVKNACDVPRICYSSRWAGIDGNTALLTAQDNQLYVYKMDL